ncbi:hypothetical protein H257_02951 [Aphanomyces astaci]|uniref:Uncharacterized protein n=1 Tax=Aphanomyces astaci TaxID=112090 RepID=W4H0L4_APHAT|nr:hypothetical protein H257_02951 [Aphanomyces astaci]ETV85091.1 hypothetical protein H257_02951 [Aphanomyces astaci]|eukprot:XP_009825109.1 hypothetical protein H257_02951 [Aphanomyces astaci]
MVRTASDHGWETRTGLQRAGTASHILRPAHFAELSIDMASSDPPSLSRNSSKCASPPKSLPFQTVKLSPKTSKIFPSGFSIPAAMVLAASPLPNQFAAPSPPAEVPAPCISPLLTTPTASSQGKRGSVVIPKSMDCPLPISMHRSK